MTIFKLIAIAIAAAVASIIVKQYKPEFALFIQLGGVTIVLLFAISYFTDIAKTANAMVEFSGINTSFFKLLLKALGISISAQLAADICRDSGSDSLAGNIELAAKLIILSMSVPLLKELAELAIGLING